MNESSEQTEPLKGDVPMPLISLRVRVVVGILLLGGLAALAVSSPQKPRLPLGNCLKAIDVTKLNLASETKELGVKK